MVESGPVEITFDAKQKVAGLEIVAGLNAANKFGKAAVEIVVWNSQAAAGPGAAEIRSNIKSRPVVRRDRNRSRQCFRRHVGGMCGNRHTDCKTREVCEKQFFHDTPERDIAIFAGASFKYIQPLLAVTDGAQRTTKRLCGLNGWCPYIPVPSSLSSFHLSQEFMGGEP